MVCQGFMLFIKRGYFGVMLGVYSDHALLDHSYERFV